MSIRKVFETLIEQTRQVIQRVDQLRREVGDHCQAPIDEACLLMHLALSAQARSVLEVGVSYGFSTLRLTLAMEQTSGRFHAMDISPRKIDAVTRHLARCWPSGCNDTASR